MASQALHFEDLYELGVTLGKGAFSVVRKAKCKKDGTDWAIKIIDKRAVGFSKEMLKQEISILKKIDHPNVIKLKEMFETDKRIYLVVEYVCGGELFDAIVEREKYAEIDAARLMNEILAALKCIHAQGVVHRDLKPENLLLSSKAEDASVKIADFGLSKVMTQRANLKTACGTPGYVAPEVLECAGYGPGVDVWSAGVIMYILLCGFPPFYEETTALLFDQIKEARYDFPSPYWDDISAKDLIRKMLVKDANKRYTVDQCLAHPWLTAQARKAPLKDFRAQMIKFNAKSKLKKAMLAVVATTTMSHILGRNHANVAGEEASVPDDE